MQQPHSLLIQTDCAINVGLLAVDQDGRVVLWNRWLEQHSDLAEQTITGLPFSTVFPSVANSRVHHSIKAALEQGMSSLISQSLNRHPFPLFVQTNRFDRHPMRQAISVMPLSCDQQRYCLVQIHDVTAAVSREQELQRIARELEQHCYQDGLTGIANRRAFDHQYPVEFRRAMREKQPLAVAMADVDYFKAYNDHYGHVAGDECLRRIASTLRRTLHRPADTVARYGGEEFTVLLPQTDRPGATYVGWSLCREILAERIPHQTSTTAPHVSISLGIVSLVPTRVISPEILLNLADQALYHAKQAGRNQAYTINEMEVLDACQAV